MKDEAVLNAWSLREVYFDKDGNPSMHRSPPLPEQEQEPWATREDFYCELNRRVERMRKEMEIKTVTMRCKEYDIALPIIEAHFGHVFVGQVFKPPQRPWVGLTGDEISSCDPYEEVWDLFKIARKLEAKLKEKNTCQE